MDRIRCRANPADGPLTGVAFAGIQRMVAEHKGEGAAMNVTIYHNPRCSKSRQTLQLLRDRGVEPQIVEYLKTPPDAATLDEFLGKLGLEPRQLMRRKEVPYAELNLADPSLDRAALIRAMVENPILIERPIVVTDGRVVLGRPPESVLEIL